MSFLHFFGLNIALALALALAVTLEMVLAVVTLKAFFDKIDIYLCLTWVILHAHVIILACMIFQSLSLIMCSR